MIILLCIYSTHEKCQHVSIGLHMEAFIDVSRRELAWEVDYIREAKCAKRFRYDFMQMSVP